VYGTIRLMSDRNWLIAFDLDGTLLDDSMTISDESRLGLEKLSDSGHACVVISARMVKSILACIGSLPFAMVAGSNGAVIYNPVSGISRTTGTIDSRIVQDIIQTYCIGKDTILHLFSPDGAWISRYDENDPFSRSYQESLDPGILDCSIDFDTCIAVEIIVQERSEYGLVAEKMRAKYPSCSISASGYGYISITGSSVDKGIALQNIADELGIPIERSLAIGDSHSDIPMLSTAADSIAMVNGATDVKKTGKRMSTFDNNSSGAVREAISVINELEHNGNSKKKETSTDKN
jgi:Cof subfamily protein (haloacid dehalogenase superfamily)